MEEALRFFRAFELWIYLLLGLVGLFFLRKFIQAWQELRGAVFGLERESSQARLNQSASVLVLLLTMAVVEFFLVSFVAPAIPGAIPLPTPTLNLLATPTITLPAQTPQAGGVQATAEPAQPAVATSTGCVPGQIEITSPKAGQEVSGAVEVIGSASLPDFDFFKLQIKRPDETIWLTILAGNSAVKNAKLADWDTSRLTPGEYQLGLVVVNHQAQASPPCTVQLRVAQAPAPTTGP